VSLRAGSAHWLLWHELRIFFFNAGFGKQKGIAKRGVGKAGIALWTLAAAVLHAFAFAMLSNPGASAAKAPLLLVMGLTGVFAAAASMMMSSGLKACVEVLFERGDLDLLLSSPLSTRAIFTVRLASIAVAIAAIFLFFLAPFAHAGLALGQYRWLAIYPVVLGSAALAASLSMLITLALVRLFGVRRTRVLAQVLGALSGAMFFLLSQLYANTLGSFKPQVAAWFAPMLAHGAVLGPDSMFWLPGHAILGAPLPLLALSLIALAVFALTVRFTHRFFVHGVQQAVSIVRVAEAPPGGQRYQFGRGLTHAVIVKEWRLIARDPQLISQVLLQLLYLLPLCFLLLFKDDSPLPGIAAALTFLCGSLTAALAWVIISAEDAPDLLRAAPCDMATIRRAKLAAVTMPVLAIVSLPLLWVLARDPLAALLTGATVVASVASSALIAMWCGRPAVRGEFKARGKGTFLSNALETLNGFAWAGMAYLLLITRLAPAASRLLLIGAGALAVIASAVLLLAWRCRHRDDWPEPRTRLRT
jgi:ABC-2 type transport system permease protein